jgi:hypothetical protein
MANQLSFLIENAISKDYQLSIEKSQLESKDIAPKIPSPVVSEPISISAQQFTKMYVEANTQEVLYLNERGQAFY